MKSTFKKMYGRAMLASLAIAAFLGIGAAVITIMAPGALQEAQAATQNFGPTVPVYAMPIQMSGNYGATVTPVKFRIPFAARLIGFSAVARAISGTLTIDLQADGVSLLSAPLTASTSLSEAVIATAAVTDEQTISVVLTISGTGASMSDISVLPTFIR